MESCQEASKSSKKEAREKFLKCLGLDDGQPTDLKKNKTEIRNKLVDELIENLVEWGPRQNLLVLYLRWAKKTANSFQSDSLAVINCLLTRYSHIFHNPQEIMEARHLQYIGLDLKNENGRFFCKTSFVTPAKTTAGRRSKKSSNKMEKSPSLALIRLSNTIELMSEMVKYSSVFGKIGRKSKTGPTMSCRSLDDQQISEEEKWKHALHKYATQNLMEFHKKHSFHNRFYRLADGRCHPYYVCRIVFEGVHNPTLFDVSVSVTQGARYPHDMHTIMAGVCLIFPDIKSIDNCENIKDYKKNPLLLQQEAICKATKISTRVSEMTELRQFIINEIRRGHGLLSLEQQAAISQSRKKGKKGKKSTTPLVPLPQLAGATRSRKEHPILAEVHQYSLDKRKVAFNHDGNNVEQPRTKKKRHTAKFTFAAPASTSTREERLNLHDQEPSSSGDLELVDLQAIAKSDHQWTQYQFELITEANLRQKCNSVLLIHGPNRRDVLLQMAPAEIYLADLLRSWEHERFTGPPGTWPKDISPAMLLIGSAHPRFLDPAELISVVRDIDDIFMSKEGALKGNSLHSMTGDILKVIRAVILFGKFDPNRNGDIMELETNPKQAELQSQFRVHIGGGRNDPLTVTDNGFFQSIEGSDLFQEGSSKDIKNTIARLVLFTWLVADEIQIRTAGVPLAPDYTRNSELAEKVLEFLDLVGSGCIVESITLVVGLLFPNFHGCGKHFDKKNNKRPGYTKTAVFQTNYTDPVSGIVIHLQIILNYRDAAGSHIQPYAKAVELVCSNIQHHLLQLQSCYNQIFYYRGVAGLVPTAFDRTNFYLDDGLVPWAKEIISPPTAPERVEVEVIRTVIGPSRVFSLSMFIEPIVNLRNSLNYEQLLELVFIAAFHNNPYFFHHVLSKLGKRHMDKLDEFEFGKHPLYDWMQEALVTFGGKWQSGKDSRYSPCGSGPSDEDIPTFFGADVPCTMEARRKGEEQLENILDVLYEYTEWIDIELFGKGDGDPIQEIPLPTIKNNQSKFADQIKGCQYGLFRLGIFTTIASGWRVVF